MRRKNLSTEFIKENICLGLIDLMKTNDYRDISISDICKKAGYGRTTYYRYFSNNKNELILYISCIKWEQYKKDHIEEVKKDEANELLKHIYNHKYFFILLSNQKLHSLLFEIFYSIFGRQKDENPILSYGKAFFAGAYFGVVYEWILQGCNDTPEEIKKKFADGFSFAINEIQNNSKIE